MGKSSDICLVVEGSYPYVTGGVSSWLQWLMENMKEFRFSIVALIAESKKENDKKYALPDNVLSYQEFVIFDHKEIKTAAPRRISKRKWRALSERLFQLMKDWQTGHLSPESLDLLKTLMTEEGPGIFRNFLDDETAFALLTHLNRDFRKNAGFLKYFYNTRNIHLILYRLLTIVPEMPPAALYHSPGTGYGGLLACLRSVIFGGKSLITEHGIYLQEREMELLKSEWLDDPFLKDMWIEMFQAICQWQYNVCDRIITLYEGNKRLQMDYGADEDTIRIIPNGIATERFLPARKPRCTADPRIVGFVGRVDSVKDIKTYIQALAMVKKAYSEVHGLIIGPKDDQPGYYQECQELIELLELKNTITFTGRADVLEYYEKMDVLLLTSIKEAMPLVVMEAMSCGIPVVATDVGACRELLDGNNDGFGHAGIVKRIMDAESIADATIKILKDSSLANAMGQTGVRRIEKFYKEDLIISQYREIYQEFIDGGDIFSAGTET